MTGEVATTQSIRESISRRHRQHTPVTGTNKDAGLVKTHEWWGELNIVYVLCAFCKDTDKRQEHVSDLIESRRIGKINKTFRLVLPRI